MKLIEFKSCIKGIKKGDIIVPDNTRIKVLTTYYSHDNHVLVTKTGDKYFYFPISGLTQIERFSKQINSIFSKTMMEYDSKLELGYSIKVDKDREINLFKPYIDGKLDNRSVGFKSGNE
jgi:hypothetical protein